MPPRCARGPRPEGPLFWDRKPLLSPYRARRAGRSAHRTLAPSPSCAAQRMALAALADGVVDVGHGVCYVARKDMRLLYCVVRRASLAIDARRRMAHA